MPEALPLTTCSQQGNGSTLGLFCARDLDGSQCIFRLFEECHPVQLADLQALDDEHGIDRCPREIGGEQHCAVRLVDLFYHPLADLPGRL
jgi:hypothetical protein